MADTEVRVSIIDRAMQLWPVLGGAAAAAGFIYHLEGATTANTGAIAEVKTSITEQDRRWQADQLAQNARVDRIEEGRNQNLQRLATVEEAVKGQKDILQDIRSKLDRALTGGRGR